MPVDHDLPAEVLERAAKTALAKRFDAMWGDMGDSIKPEFIELEADVFRAALPVLAPAIETALIERMIADARKQAKGASICDVIANWLERYPIAKGEAE